MIIYNQQRKTKQNRKGDKKMTTFIYIVNGTELKETTEAWGTEWKEAKELAKEQHCGIHRVVIRGEDVRYEFYANGSVFLNERFYTNEKIKIF